MAWAASDSSATMEHGVEGIRLGRMTLHVDVVWFRLDQAGQVEPVGEQGAEKLGLDLAAPAIHAIALADPTELNSTRSIKAAACSAQTCHQPSLRETALRDRQPAVSHPQFAT